MPPDGPQNCSFERFCFVLAHFQPTRPETEENDLNSAYHKAKLMFEVFDRDGNGQISMEEVLKTLRQMVGSNINDDQLAQVCIFRLVFLSSCSDCQTSCLRERQRWISLLNKRNAFCWNGRFPQNNGPQNSRIQNERQILNDEENNSFKFTFLPKFLIKKQLYSFIFT